MPSISMVMLVHNEMEFLPLAAASFFPLFDELVFVDMGSSDGSRDLMASLPASKTTVVDLDRTALFQEGFAAVRNHGDQFATADWIVHVDADEMIRPEDVAVLKAALGSVDKHVVDIDRRNYDRVDGLDLADWGAIVSAAPFTTETHRRAYRRTSRARWEGMIHEEVWLDDRSAFFACEHVPVTLHHLSAYRRQSRDTEKGGMYAWMTLRPFFNPELRQGTNTWWFESYVPTHLPALIAMANEFAARYDLEGFAEPPA